MRKLILKYLDETYPKSYIKETKFGNLLCFYDETWIHGEVINTIQYLFSCNKDEARIVLEIWASSRPVHKNINNTTNPDILIRKQTEYNSTL